MGLNMWQVLLVLLVFVLLFGRGRIPALMGDVAAGIRNFKQGLQDDEAGTGKMNDAEKLSQQDAGATDSQNQASTGQPHA